MMTSPFLIRPFRPADQAAARRLILQGLGEHFGVVDETLNPDIDDIAACYVDQGHLFLVALVGGDIVGTGALIFKGGPTGQLVRVSVARDCRRLGLGRALVARLIGAARDRGLTRLWMETNDDWAAAIGLYRSCGFAEYDRRDGNIYMRRDLPRNPSPRSA
jgi:ribosomal protein S18 acetylase RimI-like enzyme